MKNIKCLLGHKFISLYDIDKSTYNNEENNITLFKCKHCKKILKEQINYTNATFINKDKELPKQKARIQVREYEGWSLNNTSNLLFGIGLNNEEIGIIHLVSEDDINNMEQLGLLKFVENSFDATLGYDITAYIYESEYNEKNDFIHKKVLSTYC